MEAKAILRTARISPQKARLVADQVRGLPVGRALQVLQFSNKKAAHMIYKVVYSATSNAENNLGADVPTPATDGKLLYVLNDKGFFKEYGLDVDLQIIEEASIYMAASAAGDVASSPPSRVEVAVHLDLGLFDIAGSFGAVTLISCGIETGRQHQIRIHLSEAGHPLLGERVYDREWETRPIQCEHTLLHATSLGVRHPTRDEPLHFDEPPPPAFAAMLARLGKP